MVITNDTYCVYIHTNKVNGKVYVGQTKNGNNPEKRWMNGNGYKCCTHFWAAIKKYGWDNFDHEIIASNLTLDEANNFEELLIKKLDTMNPNSGYNLKSGGENNLYSEESRRKISASNKGKIAWNKGMNGPSGEENSFYGKHHTDESKKKMSESAKLRTGDKNPFYGKKHSDDTKKKISESRIGIDNMPKDKRQKISKIVNQYSVNGEYINTYNSYGDAGKAVGTSRQNISMASKKITLTAKGFLWFNADDETQPDKSKIIKTIQN